MKESTPASNSTFIDETRRCHEQGADRNALIDYLRFCGIEHSAAEGLLDAPLDSPTPDLGPWSNRDWRETPEIGDRVAASWADYDPNNAISDATAMARGGRSYHDIVIHLMSRQMSLGEAEHVAAMTGVRQIAPLASTAAIETSTVTPKSSLVPTVAYAAIMLLVGSALAYLDFVA